MDDIAALLKSGRIRRVLVCCGAGISTSAGIPDFRSPKTGLYHNLQKFDLDYPEQVFELDYFKRKPEPFLSLSRELHPAKYLPTMTHAFLRLLHDKGLLLRCFTQNIDTLERRAGLPDEAMVEAHGSFATVHCISKSCGQEYEAEEFSRAVDNKDVPRCEACGSLVKPDIVFFGEALPKRFFERLGDFRHADLLLVIGTSLQVQPFASLPSKVGLDCPRLLINLEAVGRFERPLDVVHLGVSDEAVVQLALSCGWIDDLTAVFDSFDKAVPHSPSSGEDRSPQLQERKEISKEASSTELSDDAVEAEIISQLAGTRL